MLEHARNYQDNFIAALTGWRLHIDNVWWKNRFETTGLSLCLCRHLLAGSRTIQGRNADFRSKHKNTSKNGKQRDGWGPALILFCSVVLFVSFSRPWSPSCWWRVLGLLGWWRGKKWQLTLLFFVGLHCCTSTGMSVRLLGANNGKQQTAKWQSAIMSRNESLASNSSLPVLHSKHLHLYKTFSDEKGCEGNLEDSPHLSNRNK